VVRFLALAALTLGAAPALCAQEKPTPAAQQAVAGKWLLDQGHSDTIPGDPLAHAANHGAISGGGGSSHSGAGVGGGGRGGSGGKGGKGAPAPAPVAPTGGDAPAVSAPVQGGFGRNRDPHLQLVLADANPGAGMVIAANDSTVAIATAVMLKADPNAQSNWKTDGRQHQNAQMDGSIIETQAMWKGGTLTVIYGIAGVGSLKREFKPSKDGKTLELKETIESNGRKADYKLIFTRE